jgi:hypothetical protein
MPTDAPLSIPVHAKAPPRPLTDEERRALLAIADVLIPASGELPAASSAPDFERWLDRALASRPEAFDDITAIATQLVNSEDLSGAVRELAAERPDAFQPVSAVLAGAYLMVPDVRKAIGYPGQERKHPRFDEAAEEIMDGILDPVIERGAIYTPAP